MNERPPGITRRKIVDHNRGLGAERMEQSERCWPEANRLYRDIFDGLGMPLREGERIVEVGRESFEAGYDRFLGVDVELQTVSGSTQTVQEKLLGTDFDTVTVEHLNDWQTLEKGDWFTLKAQLYFVGYDRNYCTGRLDPWILLDWPRLQRATAAFRVPWRMRCNEPTRVHARASFLFVRMVAIPTDCIVASSFTPRDKYQAWF